VPDFVSTASRRFVTANLAQKRRVADMMAKNDDSVDQTSLDHNEIDHMTAKRPHLNSSEREAKIRGLSLQRQMRIVPKHMIY